MKIECLVRGTGGKCVVFSVSRVPVVGEVVSGGSLTTPRRYKVLDVQHYGDFVNGLADQSVALLTVEELVGAQ